MKQSKILFIIAPKDFRDEELFVPKQFLEKKGLSLKIASTTKGFAKGKLGGEIQIDLSLEEAKAEDFDVIIFVGGPGTPIIRENNFALNLAKRAFELNKIVAAICWAPTILAKAGILKDKKATCWIGPDKDYLLPTNKVLEKFGANFIDKNVVADGNIITANGPAAAKDFAQEIFKVLSKEE